MITFKIDGKKCPIPTRWEDVTYSQYLYHVYPRTFPETLSCFAALPLERLQAATFTNLDKISLALAFMTISPKFDRTEVVGGYPVPGNPYVELLAQFEELRALIKRYPKKPREEFEYSDYETESEVYLHACAIYMQKVIDGKYNSKRIEKTKKHLKTLSCVEVIGNGAFFFAKALNLLPPSTSRFQRAIQAMKKLLPEFPGYQKTLDSLQRFTGSRGK